MVQCSCECPSLIGSWKDLRGARGATDFDALLDVNQVLCDRIQELLFCDLDDVNAVSRCVKAVVQAAEAEVCKPDVR